MEAAAWHLIRRGLTEKARAERNENMGAMPPLQAAITEMAIRELWDRVEDQAERLMILEGKEQYQHTGSYPPGVVEAAQARQKRGPGRPPKATGDGE